MFTLRTLIILCVYAAVMYFGRQLERRVAVMPAPLPGLILPVVAWIVAMVLSVNNFYIAFSVRFSIYAFIASVALFFFFAVPAMYFSLLYVEGRNTVKARREARDKRTRQARTQQNVHNDLHRRYEEEKREPLVYRPLSSNKNQDERRPATTNRTARRSQSSANRQQKSGSGKRSTQRKTKR